MKEYRITKYNPLNRNSDGHYLDDNEWICFSEVGDTVSLLDYEKTELAYIDSIIDILSSAQVKQITLTSLENAQNLCSYKNNEIISIENLDGVIKSILRNEFWGKLEFNKGFVHFGWDYYMYLGIESHSQESIDNTISRGLYVENMESPYK